MGAKISLHTSKDPRIRLRSDAVIIKKGEVCPYPDIDDYGDDETDYVIVPSVSDQVLPTKNRRMKEDLVIEAVPYAEIDNGSGGLTAVIMS